MIYLDKARNAEIAAQFNETKSKINEFKGRQIKLVRFEIWDNRGWADYSLTHPSLNKIRTFLGMSNENFVMNELGGVKTVKLNICQRAVDFVEFQCDNETKTNKIIITFDDRSRGRIYKGDGMRFSYEILNEK